MQRVPVFVVRGGCLPNAVTHRPKMLGDHGIGGDGESGPFATGREHAERGQVVIEQPVVVTRQIRRGERCSHSWLKGRLVSRNWQSRF